MSTHQIESALARLPERGGTVVVQPDGLVRSPLLEGVEHGGVAARHHPSGTEDFGRLDRNPTDAARGPEDQNLLTLAETGLPGQGQPRGDSGHADRERGTVRQRVRDLLHRVRRGDRPLSERAMWQVRASEVDASSVTDGADALGA
ncbi:hypothetical protein ACWGJ6_45945 [Streptomyces canus]